MDDDDDDRGLVGSEERDVVVDLVWALTAHTHTVLINHIASFSLHTQHNILLLWLLTLLWLSAAGRT